MKNAGAPDPAGSDSDPDKGERPGLRGTRPADAADTESEASTGAPVPSPAVAEGGTSDVAQPPAPSAGAPTPSDVTGLEERADAYKVSIPDAGFEGPLDLLLHLIQKHELDILDIPVGFVTEKYLEYLAVMKDLSIEVASEYLVMAATLAHIKSKMLLPEVPKDQEDAAGDEDEADPRMELVRRLLEYQKFKQAAEQLGARDVLGRDVFPRGTTVEQVDEGPAPFAPVGVFSLLDAFSKVLARVTNKVEHEVVFDRISISDRITELTDLLRGRGSLPFEELFDRPTRFDVVITFLAVLEMVRLKMLRVYQTESLSPIHVELTLLDDAGDDPLALHSVPPTADASGDAAAAPEDWGARSVDADDDKADANDDEADDDDEADEADDDDDDEADDDDDDDDDDEADDEASASDAADEEADASDGDGAARAPLASGAANDALDGAASETTREVDGEAGPTTEPVSTSEDADAPAFHEPTGLPSGAEVPPDVDDASGDTSSETELT